jgi:hypothetical protein
MSPPLGLAHGIFKAGVVLRSAAVRRTWAAKALSRNPCSSASIRLTAAITWKCWRGGSKAGACLKSAAVLATGSRWSTPPPRSQAENCALWSRCATRGSVTSTIHVPWCSSRATALPAGRIERVPVLTDPRRRISGESTTFRVATTLAPGEYDILLYLPDATTSLREARLRRFLKWAAAAEIWRRG